MKGEQEKLNVVENEWAIQEGILGRITNSKKCKCKNLLLKISWLYNICKCIKNVNGVYLYQGDNTAFRDRYKANKTATAKIGLYLFKLLVSGVQQMPSLWNYML